MKLTQIEVSLSKEERRIVDEYGNAASTWARIGITAELEEGDLPENCIKLLKNEIQPQVDDWLLNQGGYASTTGVALAGGGIEEVLDDVFGDGPYKISIVEPDSPNDGAASDANDDEIPL